MYCVTLRLHDVKKLTSVPLEYTMEVHLPDAYILPFFMKVLPPPFHYSLGSYLYSFFVVQVKIDSKISSST